jgi:hypothetical protein
MPILPGKRPGPCEIFSAIGADGMGEVYKARDIFDHLRKEAS